MEILIMILVTLCSILLFAWLGLLEKNYKNEYEIQVNRKAFEMSRGYYQPQMNNSYLSNNHPHRQGKKKSSPFAVFALITTFVIMSYLFITVDVEPNVKSDNNTKTEQLDNQIKSEKFSFSSN